MAQEKKAPGKLAQLAFVAWLLYIAATGRGAILFILYLVNTESAQHD